MSPTYRVLTLYSPSIATLLRTSVALGAFSCVACADGGADQTSITWQPPPVVEVAPPEPAYDPRPLVQGKPAKPRKQVSRPSAETVNAVTQYRWEDGMVWRIATSPGFLTTVMLEPGEKLISRALGETNESEWKIDDTLTGVGTKIRAVVLIKPARAGMHTNGVLTTDRRTYQLDIRSYTKPAMDTVQWTYGGANERLVTQVASIGQVSLPRAGYASSVFDPMRLNFSYKIETVKGDDPRWKPQVAFDDGEREYILFPQGLGTVQAVPLFILDSGSAEIANFRVVGRYYSVDRLYDTAELRLLSEKSQTIVRIRKVQ